MWQAATDKHGRQYFYNKYTRVTTWEKPKELWTPQELQLHRLGWQRYTTKDGRPYWYNGQLKKSVWNPLEISEGTSTETNEDNLDGSPAKRAKIVDNSDTSDLYSAFDQACVIGKNYRDALPSLIHIEQFRCLENMTERVKAFEDYQRIRGIRNSSIESEKNFSDAFVELEKFKTAKSFSEIEPYLATSILSSRDKKKAFEVFAEAGSIISHKYAPEIYENEKGRMEHDLSTQLSQQSVSNVDVEQLMLILKSSDNFSIEENDKIEICKASIEKYCEKVNQWLLTQANREDREDRHARENFILYLSKLPKSDLISWSKIVEKRDKPLKEMCGRIGSGANELYAEYVSRCRSLLKDSVKNARELMARHDYTIEKISENKLRDFLVHESDIEDVDTVLDVIFRRPPFDKEATDGGILDIPQKNGKMDILPY